MADPKELTLIADALQNFKDAGEPDDLRPKVKSFVQYHYDTLANQGFWRQPDNQGIGHSLRAMGMVSDPLQGGALKNVETGVDEHNQPTYKRVLAVPAPVASPAHAPTPSAAQKALAQQRYATWRANLTAPAGQPGENPPDGAYKTGVADSLAAVESVVKPVTKFVQRSGLVTTVPPSILSGIRQMQAKHNGTPVAPPSKFEQLYTQESDAAAKGAVGLVAAPVQLGVMGLHGLEDNARANRHAETADIQARRGNKQAAAKEQALSNQYRKDTQQITSGLVSGVRNMPVVAPAAHAVASLVRGDTDKAKRQAKQAGADVLNDPVGFVATFMGGAGASASVAEHLSGVMEGSARKITADIAAAVAKGDTEQAAILTKQLAKNHQAQEMLRQKAQTLHKISNPIAPEGQRIAGNQAKTLENSADLLHQQANVAAARGELPAARHALTQAAQLQEQSHAVRTGAGVSAMPHGTPIPDAVDPVAAGVHGAVPEQLPGLPPTPMKMVAAAPIRGERHTGPVTPIPAEGLNSGVVKPAPILPVVRVKSAVKDAVKDTASNMPAPQQKNQRQPITAPKAATATGAPDAGQITNKEQFSAAIKKNFGYTQEEADHTAAIADARANAWAKANNSTPDQWYKTRISGIANGKDVKAGDLLQSGSIKRALYSTNDVKALRQDKDAIRANGYQPADVKALVDKYFNAEKYKDLNGKDNIYLPMPSTSGKNIIPHAVAQELADRYGGEVLVNWADPVSLKEAKAKRFLEKVADPQNFDLASGLSHLKGKNVVLVDDVFNTGDSVAGARRALSGAGITPSETVALGASDAGMTSPRDIERISEKIAKSLGIDYNEVHSNVDRVLSGTGKQFANYAERDMRGTPANFKKKAQEVYDAIKQSSLEHGPSSGVREDGARTGAVQSGERPQAQLRAGNTQGVSPMAKPEPNAEVRRIQTSDPLTNEEPFGIPEGSSAVSPQSPDVLKQGPRGSVQFLDDGSAIITALQNPNVSTVVHELGHIFRRDLEGQHLANVEAWAGVKNGKWKDNTAAEEKFARAFERYLRKGEAPTPELKTVFAQFKDWLREIYQTIKDSPLAGSKVSPEVKAAFDHLLGKEDATTKVKSPVTAEEMAAKPKTDTHPPVDSSSSQTAGAASAPEADRTKAAPDRVGSINLDRMGLTDAEKQKVKGSAEAAGLTVPSYRSNADTVAAAKKMGVTLETLRKVETPGEIPHSVRDHAAYKHAVREIHAQTARTAAAAEEIYKARPTPENLSALNTANEDLALAVRHDAAFSTQAGQDLQARSIVSDPFIAQAEGDLFRQPSVAPAKEFHTRQNTVQRVKANKTFTADVVAEAKARIAARGEFEPGSLAQDDAPDVLFQDDKVTPGNLRDFGTVGAAYIEAGANTYGKWFPQMKADYPKLSPGDLWAIWAQARHEIQSASPVRQSPKLPPDLFLDQYAQRHGRENAANFAHDLIDHTGDTSLLEKVATGKALTAEEQRVVNAAEVANSRTPGTKGKLSPGMQALKDAREAVAAEKGGKPTAKTSTPQEKLATTFRSRLGKEQGDKFLAAADQGVLHRLAIDTKSVAPDEYKALAKQYEAFRVKAGKPAPGALQEFQKVLAEVRKEAAQSAPKATPTEAQVLVRHLSQRLTPKGAVEIVHQIGPGIFGKLARGQELTQDEARKFSLAYETVKQPRTPGTRSALSQTLTDTVKATQDVTKAEMQKAALADFTMRKANAKAEVLKTLKPERIPEFTKALADVKQDDLFGLRQVMNKFSHDEATLLEIAMQMTGVGRSLVAGGDFSNIGRQGAMLGGAHPQLILPAIKAGNLARKSEKAALEADIDIRTRPNAEVYKKAGLEFGSVDDSGYSLASLAHRDENHASALLENAKIGKVNIGGYFRSRERANTVYLNHLRADVFDLEYKRLSKNGPVSDQDAKAWAGFINDATGRASLGEKGNQAAAFLNQLAFSARFTWSRARIVTGAPMMGKIAGVESSTAVKAGIARTYLQYAASAATVITLAKLAGADVNMDPRSSDFLKMKFGPLVVDPMAGFAQISTFLARELSQSKASQSGKITPLDGKAMNGTGWTLLANFLRSKASPLAGTAIDVLDAQRDLRGKPITALGTREGNYLDGEVQRNVVTMAAPDTVSSIINKNYGAAIANIVGSQLGVGVSYRDPSDKPAKKNPVGDPSAIPDLKLPDISLPKL